MTSLHYDDSIEIISYHGDCNPSSDRTTYVSFNAFRSDVRRGHHGNLRVIKSQPVEILPPQYKRMRCAIIVMATLMILASMILVGVSLSMAEHIDELGK